MTSELQILHSNEAFYLSLMILSILACVIIYRLK